MRQRKIAFSMCDKNLFVSNLNQLNEFYQLSMLSSQKHTIKCINCLTEKDTDREMEYRQPNK